MLATYFYVCVCEQYQCRSARVFVDKFVGVCMYICVWYVYISVCILSLCVCGYTCAYICMCFFVCAYIFVSECVCVYMCM